MDRLVINHQPILKKTVVMQLNRLMIDYQRHASLAIKQMDINA